MKRMLGILVVAVLLAALGLGCSGDKSTKNKDWDRPKPAEKNE